MDNPNYTDEQVKAQIDWFRSAGDWNLEAMLRSLIAERAAVPDGWRWEIVPIAVADTMKTLRVETFGEDQLTAAPQPPEGSRVVDDEKWNDFADRLDKLVPIGGPGPLWSAGASFAYGDVARAIRSMLAAPKPPEDALVVDGWQPIESAPTDGTLHVRGLWVRTPRGSYFDAVVGGINDEGEFVDMDHDSTRWDASDYTHWHRLSAAPTLAGKEG